MQLEVDFEHSLVAVALSESNVLALLAQIAGFHEDFIGIRRLVESDWWLRVAPQPDQDHLYGAEGLAFSVNPARREVIVVLSASNLAALREQARAREAAPLARTAENGWMLTVVAESDQQHYGSRRRGLMQGITEQAMDQLRDGGHKQ